MVSRISLTAQRTSPTLLDSPGSARVSTPLYHSDVTPCRRAETPPTRKKLGAFDGITKAEMRTTDLHGIAEETPDTSTGATATKLPPANHAESISKRRGFRPLSVRIGEAFSPFSPRGTSSNKVASTPEISDLVQDNSRDPQGRLELSKQVNWSENLDPHIFNANYIATLTSKCESTPS